MQFVFFNRSGIFLVKLLKKFYSSKIKYKNATDPESKKRFSSDVKNQFKVQINQNGSLAITYDEKVSLEGSLIEKTVDFFSSTQNKHFLMLSINTINPSLKDWTP